MTKPHVFHSLVCALIHNHDGLPGAAQVTGLNPIGAYYSDRETALISLKRLCSGTRGERHHGLRRLRKSSVGRWKPSGSTRVARKVALPSPTWSVRLARYDACGRLDKI